MDRCGRFNWNCFKFQQLNWWPRIQLQWKHKWWCALISQIYIFNCQVATWTKAFRQFLFCKAGFGILYLSTGFECHFGCELIYKILQISKDLIVAQVGEAIPLSDASVDAVVGTLVLCSVKDVDMTLKGTQTSSCRDFIFIFTGFKELSPSRNLVFCEEHSVSWVLY